MTALENMIVLLYFREQVLPTSSHQGAGTLNVFNVVCRLREDETNVQTLLAGLDNMNSILHLLKEATNEANPLVTMITLHKREKLFFLTDEGKERATQLCQDLGLSEKAREWIKQAFLDDYFVHKKYFWRNVLNK